MALKRAGIRFIHVAVSEIDKYAYAAYCAIHGDTPNLGDIRKIKHLPECDLLTYSFPCQDISIAGNGKGFSEGSDTRSGLLWEVKRLLLDMKERGCLPNILLMENVDAIVNSKNVRNFNLWIRFLSDMGYTSSWKILNAKDFDIPQNRARCYMVSCLDGTHFEFPKEIPKIRHLKDVLEDDVDDRFYLSADKIQLIKRSDNDVEIVGILSSSQDGVICDPEGISPCHTAGHGNCPKIICSPRYDSIPIKHSYKPKLCDISGDSSTIMAGTHGWNSSTPLIQVAQLHGKHEQTGRVYSIEGDCPAVNTCGGGDRQPKIAVYPCITPDRINKRQNGPRFRKDGDDMFAITCQDRHGVLICNNTELGYIEAGSGDGIILDQPNSKTKRGRVQKGMSPTIMTSGQVGVIIIDGEYYAIRRLTPRECWRVMDFTDEDYDLAKAAIVNNKPMSETQLYKQAGNSICVGVLVAIFKDLYLKKQFKQPSLKTF